MWFVKITVQEGSLKEGEKPKTWSISHKEPEQNEAHSVKNQIYSEVKHTQ